MSWRTSCLVLMQLWSMYSDIGVVYCWVVGSIVTLSNGRLSIIEPARTLTKCHDTSCKQDVLILDRMRCQWSSTNSSRVTLLSTNRIQRMVVFLLSTMASIVLSSMLITMISRLSSIILLSNSIGVSLGEYIFAATTAMSRFLFTRSPPEERPPSRHPFGSILVYFNWWSSSRHDLICLSRDFGFVSQILAFWCWSRLHSIPSSNEQSLAFRLRGQTSNLIKSQT